MTMHSYRPSADMNILVEMGYDRPLNRLFLTIYGNPNTSFEVFLYNCLDDPDRSTFTDHSVPKTDLLAYFCRKIMDVSKGAWDIPDQMKLNILADAFAYRGNQMTTYEDDL